MAEKTKTKKDVEKAPSTRSRATKTRKTVVDPLPPLDLRGAYKQALLNLASQGEFGVNSVLPLIMSIRNFCKSRKLRRIPLEIAAPFVVLQREEELEEYPEDADLWSASNIKDRGGLFDFLASQPGVLQLVSQVYNSPELRSADESTNHEGSVSDSNNKPISIKFRM